MTPPAQSAADARDFVAWFRQATPYIHAHRGRTFVLAFGGEAVQAPGFAHLVEDVALLHGLGIRLVLVFGARPQIEARLRQRAAALQVVNGLRVTDDAALTCVTEAAGTVRVEIEARLSMGLASSPLAGARLRVTSGNFVTAKPLGVIDGVDYRHTGEVRRVDAAAMSGCLDDGAIVLLPPLGYSRTGEVFNLSAADIAGQTAVALGADKLILLMEEPLVDAAGGVVSNMLPGEVDALLADAAADALAEPTRRVLGQAAQACRRGVPRVHLLSRGQDGALLQELFTREGSGTLVSADPYERLRPARLDDLAGIIALIEPLEHAGVLVPRPREVLETELAHFQVVERDGVVVACAALYPYPATGCGELACLAVHPDYRDSGRGDRLLEALQQAARGLGLDRLFVLTTRTAHWFVERGFVATPVESLPATRRTLYNWQRNAKVFIKTLH